MLVYLCLGARNLTSGGQNNSGVLQYAHRAYSGCWTPNLIIKLLQRLPFIIQFSTSPMSRMDTKYDILWKILRKAIFSFFSFCHLSWCFVVHRSRPWVACVHAVTCCWVFYLYSEVILGTKCLLNILPSAYPWYPTMLHSSQQPSVLFLQINQLHFHGLF